MRELPILFSTPMVKAIMEGRKTQTRRIVKEFDPKDWRFSHDRGDEYFCFKNHDYTHGGNVLNPRTIKCPYGYYRDVLYVRETCREYHVTYPDSDRLDLSHLVVEYAADKHEMIPMIDGDGFQMYNKNGSERFIAWKPSIHMPKDRARIWLQVESVGVERLQEISEEDAIAEGVVQHSDYGSTGYVNYLKPLEAVSDIDAAWSYQTLWESINGPGSWEANPFVWVIKFKVLSTTGKL